MNVEVPLQIRKKKLRRRSSRRNVQRAESHGKIIQPLDERIYRQRHGRVRHQRIILRRNVERRLPKIHPSIDGDARLPLDLRQPLDLRAESIPRRLLHHKSQTTESKIEKKKKIRRRKALSSKDQTLACLVSIPEASRESWRTKSRLLVETILWLRQMKERWDFEGLDLDERRVKNETVQGVEVMMMSFVVRWRFNGKREKKVMKIRISSLESLFV